MVFIRTIVVLLLWTSAIAVHAETNQNDIKLVSLSVVCDPPRLYSSDPLGLREDQMSHKVNASINAFELRATSYFDTNNKLEGGTIEGSFNEVLVPIDVTQNKILFSSTTVNILHAIELKKVGSTIQAQLHLIDKTKIETICYETSEGYFD